MGSIAVALALCGTILFPALSRPSNCGGNSAALSACKSISVCFRLIAAERGDGAVSISELSRAERDYFKQVAGLSWLGQSRVLITPTRVGVGGATGRVVIAACDRAFDNVPRRMFGKAPLTHAVAYADGSNGLMPAEEFRRLDLSSFVDVRSIQGPKAESGRRED
jgi:hypothetical protein